MITLMHKRGTAAALTAANPVLAPGEFGVETDTLKIKIGDGTTAWTSLAYIKAGSATTATTATNLAGGTAGQISYQSAPGVTSFIPVGTAGQVLVSNGTSAPSWGSSDPNPNIFLLMGA